MAPIGLAIAGPLSDAYGVRTIYLGAGILCLAAGIAAVFIPDLLDFEAGQGKAS
jgi:MFS family permease